MLTFEKIRELYDKEKDSPKIQPMPEDFLIEASEYMKGSDETIKKVLNNLLDRRQQKLMNLAIFELKKDTPAKPSNMTLEEENAFVEIVSILKRLRTGIYSEKNAIHAPLQGLENRVILNDDNASPKSDPVTVKIEEKDGFVMINETLPSFIGTDMKTYYLKKGDKVYLPKELREFLEKNGVCERLN